MITGMLMEVTSEDLVERINMLVARHQAKANEYAIELRRILRHRPTAKEREARTFGLGSGSMREELTLKIREHEERAEALAFLAKHIVPGEVYRVSRVDLQVGDLFPARLGSRI